MFIFSLRDMYCQYAESSEVLILGDLNAQVRGPRCTPPISARSGELCSFMHAMQLLFLSVAETCTGPALRIVRMTVVHKH